MNMNTSVQGHHGETVKIILEPAWAQILAPTITNCVAIDNLHNSSKPQFPHLKMRVTVPTSQDCRDDSMSYMLRA